MKKQMLLLMALGLTLISYAQKTETEKTKDIDDFLSYNVTMNKFNGSVLVAHGKKILLSKGYGYRDFEKKLLNDTTSIFQIYSITKTFTSTMIFKLIEQKKLTLDDRLSKFYPSFANGDSITIEHLLTHTSGINEKADMPNAPATEEYRVALFSRNKPNFSPGKGWAYCNGGYQLLGYIIGKVTGMPYELAIRKSIFNPLRMTKSGFDFMGLSNTSKVTAYHIVTNNKKERAVLYDSAGPFSAGSIYSTVGDMYKYYKSFKNHSIISEASQEIAFSPSKTNPAYGHGWQLKTDENKKRVVSHSGGAAGFRTNFAMALDEDICVIILNNHENAYPEYLTEKIIDILNNKPLNLTQEKKLKATDLEKMVGTFSLKEPWPMMLYISILDGRLAIDIAGQGKATVVAKNETTFIQEEANLALEFVKDEKGVYSEINITQGSQKMNAKRIISSWGLIGDATSKGWEDTTPDIKFTEDKEKKGLWHLVNITLSKGEIKFRLNNDWSVNYGDNKADNVLDINGENIKIAAGRYDIILDLTNEAMPKYTISKKN
jgi:CubicO group peptidase (beta-lactamase class C family)